MDRETIKRQIQLYHSDCLGGMERVESGSVDLILCDLPYGTTDCSWDTVIPFEPLWAQYRRVLKPRGAAVLMAAQPFATDLINSARKLFRYDLVWEKSAPVGFANCHRPPLRSHELILVFYRHLPTYHPQGLIKLEKPIQKAAARREHPTQKPLELMEYLVNTYTDPGDLVMDNCMGSGTTAVAALNTGRRFIGFERELNYYQTACRRVADRAEELTAA